MLCACRARWVPTHPRQPGSPAPRPQTNAPPAPACSAGQGRACAVVKGQGRRRRAACPAGQGGRALQGGTEGAGQLVLHSRAGLEAQGSLPCAQRVAHKARGSGAVPGPGPCPCPSAQPLCPAEHPARASRACSNASLAGGVGWAGAPRAPWKTPLPGCHRTKQATAGCHRPTPASRRGPCRGQHPLQSRTSPAPGSQQEPECQRHGVHGHVRRERNAAAVL